MTTVYKRITDVGLAMTDNGDGTYTLKLDLGGASIVIGDVGMLDTTDTQIDPATKGQLPASLGQKAKAASLAVVLPSDQTVQTSGSLSAALPAGTNNIGNVDIATQPAGECATVTEYNLTLTNANTEYSQALPANARKIIFRCRTAYDVRYAWVTDKVATPTAPYQTLRASAEYAVDGIKLASGTIYLASATAGAIIEIEAWS